LQSTANPERSKTRKWLKSTTMAEISRPAFRNFSGPQEFKQVATLGGIENLKG
jgi:hypothetical protein